MGSMTAVAEKSLKTSHPRVCSVGVFVKDLPESDAKEFLVLLADARISCPALSAALRDEYGIRLSSSQLLKHRKEDCRCR
jgi:hypothetical protein